MEKIPGAAGTGDSHTMVLLPHGWSPNLSRRAGAAPDCLFKNLSNFRAPEMHLTFFFFFVILLIAELFCLEKSRSVGSLPAPAGDAWLILELFAGRKKSIFLHPRFGAGVKGGERSLGWDHKEVLCLFCPHKKLSDPSLTRRCSFLCTNVAKYWKYRQET